MEVGQLLQEGIYRLVEARKPGGMAVVFRAEVLKGPFAGQFVAIKTPRQDKSEVDGRRSLRREADALRIVSGHPNIVRHIDYGETDQGEPYLVLEWLEHTLAEEILRRGKMRWEEWLKDVGSPILDGLVHAHSNEINIAHRDLSPGNIMFASDGQPKIVDFGLAVEADSVRGKGTLAGHGSPPFTPGELDDGLNRRSRDCFSWAALTVCALAGRFFTNIDEIRHFVAQSNTAKIPVEILEKALSDKVEQRYRLAKELKSEIASFEYRRLVQNGAHFSIRLEAANSVGKELCEATNTTDPLRAMSEIATNFSPQSKFSSEKGDNLKLRIVSNTIELLAYVKDDCLLLYRARRLDVIVAGRKREAMVSVPVKFRINSIARSDDEAEMRMFQEALEQGEHDRERAEAERARFALFERWAKYLDEKLALAHKKRYKVGYTEIEAVDEEFVATIEEDFDPDQLGSDVIIRSGPSRATQLIVVKVSRDQIRLRPRSGETRYIPPVGQIEKDPHREKISINRQRQALEIIRGHRAASYGAISWITEPQSCQPPEKGGVPCIERLSPDKLEILDAALGVQSVLSVAGPPGTGKTTLIAALVTAYLQRYPTHRILLTSQTHVAIDNAIDKLVLADQSTLIRIGSEYEQKIAANSKNYLISRRFREWRDRIRQRSKAFLNQYAEQQGIRVDNVAICMHFAEVNTLEDQIARATREHGALLAEQERIAVETNAGGASTTLVDDAEVLTATIEASEIEQELLEQIDSFRKLLRDAQSQLKKIPGYGDSLVRMNRPERDEWLRELDSKTPNADRLRRLIKVQQVWLAGLSRREEFEYAVLSEARIVAGTCVGIARDAFFKDTFDLCIIDEAGKATPTEALIPLSRSRRWVVVGDRRQLPPYMDATERGKASDHLHPDVLKTFLDRLEEQLPDPCKKALTEQRRMCWSIGELIAHVFYSDMTIKNVEMDARRAAYIAARYPSPVTWISTSRVAAPEEKYRKSRRNSKEAEIIVSEIESLAGLIPLNEEIDIAVITGYSAQARMIDDALQSLRSRRPLIHIDCNTIDAFQGQEAKVCYYSVTRSNSADELGFLREFRRLNVALSRGQDALVIVGDDAFCRTCPPPNPFVDVLRHIDANLGPCERRIYAGN